MEISTSILSVKKENAIRTFYDLEVAKTDYFHIDVMDGKFVEQNTMLHMLEYATTIKHISNIPLDVHLMVNKPREQIEDYIDLKPTYITVHYEAFEKEKQLEDTLLYIKQNGCRAGISIKPDTSVEKIYPYLEKISLVLVMTVEPGYGGQKLIETTIPKIKKLKTYIEENKLECFIEADGGINLENIEKLNEAGIDIAVVGSAIINSNNMKETIQKMKH